MNLNRFPNAPDELQEVAEARTRCLVCLEAVDQAKSELAERKKELEEAQSELARRLDEVLGDQQPSLFNFPPGATINVEYTTPETTKKPLALE